jgi:hypothetical protein
MDRRGPLPAQAVAFRANPAQVVEPAAEDDAVGLPTNLE